MARRAVLIRTRERKQIVLTSAGPPSCCTRGDKAVLQLSLNAVDPAFYGVLSR